MNQNESQSMRSRVTRVLVPGLIAFSMGQTVLFAIAGPVFRDIGLSEGQLGMIISAAAVVFVFASGVWGRISDRWGRRPTIVFGLVCYGVVSLIFAYVMQVGLAGGQDVLMIFILLLALRLLYAALGAGIQPASVALMADISSDDERSSAVAVVGAAFGVGMVLGPASAAVLVGFGVLTPLYIIAGLGLVSALFAGLYLPEPERESSGQEESQSSVALSVILLLLTGSFLLYVAMSAIQQTMAFNLQDLLQTSSADTARLTGFCFIAIAVATLLMQGVIIQKLKPQPQKLLGLGVPIILVSLLIYSQVTTFSGLLLAAVFIGIGFGLTTPGLMSAASLLAGDNEQGRVAGMIQATMSAGYVVGPISATTLYELERTYAAMFALSAAIFALLSILVWLRTSGRRI